jgi:hypothetical protein
MPSLTGSLSSRTHARLTPAITGFWRWWTGELLGLLPSGAGKGAYAEIRPGRTDVMLVRSTRNEGERLVEHKPLGHFDAENWAEIEALTTGYRTRVLLGPPLVHIITLDLPKAARTRLRSAIPLQLRSHAPVLPELLHWAILDTKAESERLHVRVALVRITTLDDIAQGFRNHGLAAAAILAACEGAQPVLLRPAESMTIRTRLRQPWTIAVAVLLSTPIWMLLALHLLGAREQARADTLGRLASPRLATERRLNEAAQTGAALKDLFAIPPATDAIENLARRVPENAHAVEVAGQDDGGLAFTLETTDPDALRTALTGDTPLPRLREVNQTKTDSGPMRVHYEAGPG